MHQAINGGRCVVAARHPSGRKEESEARVRCSAAAVRKGLL